METDDRYLGIVFAADGTNQGAGFSLIYSEVSVTCGGNTKILFFIMLERKKLTP
jgi:hypothetical protein